MSSITEGAKARQEALAMELKFHKDKLKELTGESKYIEKKSSLSKVGLRNDVVVSSDYTNITLIFGYASVIWKPGFPYTNKWWGYIKNYKRRFWQGSPDHRGTPRYPGRVATLLPANIVDDLEKKSQEEDSQRESISSELSATAKTWGVVYEIDPKESKEILSQLDQREKAGFIRVILQVYCEDGETRNALVYSATQTNGDFLGPSNIYTMGWHIFNSTGPSGPNKDYLYNLYDVLIVEKKINDLHIESLYKICKGFDNLKVCTKLNDFEKNQDFYAQYYGFGRPIRIVNVEWPHIFYYYIADEVLRDGGNGEFEGMDKIVHTNALFHLRHITNAFGFKILEEDSEDGSSVNMNKINNIENLNNENGEDNGDSSSSSDDD
eukprot:g2481.t1